MSTKKRDHQACRQRGQEEMPKAEISSVGMAYSWGQEPRRLKMLMRKRSPIAEGKGKETLTPGRREMPRYQLASTRPLRKQLQGSRTCGFQRGREAQPPLGDSAGATVIFAMWEINGWTRA